MTWPFVVVEGVDGAGKTTLAGALTTHWHGLGIDVFSCAFPSRFTVSGQHMRRCLATGQVLPNSAVYHMLADMADMTPKITARLQEGVVLADRYTMSTAVYQQNGLQLITDRILAPDWVIYCKAPLDRLLAEAQRRHQKKQAETFDSVNPTCIQSRVSLYESACQLKLMKNLYVADMTLGLNDLVMDITRAILDV